MDTEVDARLGKIGTAAAGLRGQAAIANARLAYQHYERMLGSPRWAALAGCAARAQAGRLVSDRRSGVPFMIGKQLIISRDHPGRITILLIEQPWASDQQEDHNDPDPDHGRNLRGRLAPATRPATVTDVMRPPLTTVERTAHVAAAAYLMKHAGTTALVVLDEQADRPAGIITDTDVAHVVAVGKFDATPPTSGRAADGISLAAVEPDTTARPRRPPLDVKGSNARAADQADHERGAYSAHELTM